MATPQIFHRIGGAGVGTGVILKNSVQLSVGDPLTIDSNGYLDIASTTSKIIGYSLEDVTAASDNQTVAMVKPVYVEAARVRMIYQADQACTQTDIGAYADLGTASTGACVLNLAAGATGQFLVEGFDPYGTGDTTLCVVVVAEPQQLAFAQS